MEGEFLERLSGENTRGLHFLRQRQGSARARGLSSRCGQHEGRGTFLDCLLLLSVGEYLRSHTVPNLTGRHERPHRQDIDRTNTLRPNNRLAR